LKKQTFSVLGAALDTGNRGVSALAVSSIGLLRKAFPNATPLLLIGHRTGGDFNVFVNDEEVRGQIVNFRQSFKAERSQQIVWLMFLSFLCFIFPFQWFKQAIARRNRWIDCLLNSELVGEIRGGDSFSDIYGMQRFLVGMLPAISTILVRGKITLLPQTYGPFKSRTSRVIARWVLRRADLVMSRDTEGAEMVRKLVGREDVVICCDVAFSLQPRAPKAINIAPELPSVPNDTLIGLNVNGLMYRGGYTQDNMFGLKLDYQTFLVDLANRFLENPAFHLVLVPHTFAPPENVESDPEACRLLKSKLSADVQDRVHLVTGEYDQSEIKYIIGQCSFFIGSRMHACIAALSQGIPAVGVAYSKKFLGVFRSVGMESCVVDGRECDSAEAVARIARIFQNRDEVRAKLKPALESAKAHLTQTFTRLS
jgi:colanic acid/amylovoran biosynthesis protein